MCSCAYSSFDILNKLNNKRISKGLNEVNYDWLMIQHRNKWKHFRPTRKIGNSLIWSEKAANKIINKLQNIHYRTSTNLYSMAA